MTQPKFPGLPAELSAALERLAGIPDAVRQTLTDHLHATIPVYVNEYSYNPSQAPGLPPLTVTPQTGGLELITAIVCVVPSGSTGLLQLGALKLPVAAGLTVITPVKLFLGSTDLRSLTLAGGSGGASTLFLCGDQLPTFGVMAP